MQAVLPDGLLAALIGVAAIIVVLVRDFRKTAGLFFAFCLLMAVAWVRLKLPWLGAVEVAIGALMTGWVVHHALGLLPGYPGPDTAGGHSKPFPRAGIIMPLAGSIVFMGLLAASAYLFPHPLPWSEYTWYTVAGIMSAVAGFFSLTRHRHLLDRVLAFNVLGSGIFLLTVCFAGKRGLPMAVPFAMVTAGLLAAFVASLMVVILLGRRPVPVEPDLPGKAGSYDR